MEMFYFNYTLEQIIDDPRRAFRGAVVCDTRSDRLVRYLVKDVINDIPLLVEFGDSHHTALPNYMGDYMLNLRTGYVSFLETDTRVSEPLDKHWLDSSTLSSLRERLID